MNTKKRTTVARGVLCWLMGVLPACGADAPGPGSAPIPGPEDVDVVEQPLFEPTCWTSTLPDAIVDVHSTQGGYPVSSANASYGHTSCPHQFVVDFQLLGGHSFRVSAEPTSQGGANSDWCPGFWETTKVRGWTGSQWVDLDYYQEAGLYTGGLFFFPTCTESVTAGQFPPVHPKTHGFTAIRVVTQGGFANTYQPVSVLLSTDI